MDITKHVSMDQLFRLVEEGGRVKTGVDVFDSDGLLLIDKNFLIDSAKILERIRGKGVKSLPVNPFAKGGLWDKNGAPVLPVAVEPAPLDNLAREIGAQDEFLGKVFPDLPVEGIEMRLVEIEEMKNQAREKYQRAKDCIKTTLRDIRETGGHFDCDGVEAHVSEMVGFLGGDDNPFSYLAREIFSYDDYLYNHSINVCTIGAAVLNQFNTHFSGYVNHCIRGEASREINPFEAKDTGLSSFTCFYPGEVRDIALGFILHDIGKVQVPYKLLVKKGGLTLAEYEKVKKHSFEYGVNLLEKNNIRNSFVRNIIKYHHSPLYRGEERSYPLDREYNEIPVYARICKLADIFDAMTSKRSYKDAFNPINIVTRLFRTYANKDNMLQFILHSFVKSIGIYPPGSIIYLKNGQMAYVLESCGPLVVPFTDGRGNTLGQRPDPININDPGLDSALRVDSGRSVKEPKEVYSLLPAYLRSAAV